MLYFSFLLLSWLLSWTSVLSFPLNHGPLYGDTASVLPSNPQGEPPIAMPLLPWQMGEKEGGSQESPSQEEYSLGKELSQPLLTLGLLLAIALILSWAIRRRALLTVSHHKTRGSIELLERRALSPKSILYLIEIGETQILIGESPTGISILPIKRGENSHTDIRENKSESRIVEP